MRAASSGWLGSTMRFPLTLPVLAGLAANNDRHNIVNNMHPRALTAANITP